MIYIRLWRYFGNYCTTRTDKLRKKKIISMEFFLILIAHFLVVCLRGANGVPLSLSSSGQSRRYSLDELDELVKELQKQGATPTSASGLTQPLALADEVEFDKKSPLNGYEEQRQNTAKKSKLERIFKKAYGNPGSVFIGDTIYSLRRWDRLRFDFDPTKYVNIARANFRLYKLPLKEKLRRRGFGSLSTRVHIFNAPKRTRFLTGATLIDSQSVRLSKTGWVTFDVTSAVQQWLISSRRPTLNKNTLRASELTEMSPRISRQYLEIWIESTEMGRQATKTTRNTKFVQSRSRRHPDRRPQLELFYHQSL